MHLAMAALRSSGCNASVDRQDGVHRRWWPCDRLNGVFCWMDGGPKEHPGQSLLATVKMRLFARIERATVDSSAGSRHVIWRRGARQPRGARCDSCQQPRISCAALPQRL
jgi:hypothetical protein